MNPVLAVGMGIFMLWALSGCAHDKRYLTVEQDKAMAEQCANGCAVIPKQTWDAIMEAISAHRGQRL